MAGIFLRLRFAARHSGLAFGLARAVMPAGAGRGSWVKGVPEGMRPEGALLTLEGQPGQCAAHRSGAAT
jgi:hypothetical protein